MKNLDRYIKRSNLLSRVDIFAKIFMWTMYLVICPFIIFWLKSDILIKFLSIANILALLGILILNKKWLRDGYGRMIFDFLTYCILLPLGFWGVATAFLAYSGFFVLFK